LVVAGCDGSLELYDMNSEPPEVEVIQRPLREDKSLIADLNLFVSEDGSILVILCIAMCGLHDDECV
jgi:hypothetical protein